MGMTLTKSIERRKRRKKDKTESEATLIPWDPIGHLLISQIINVRKFTMKKHL